ncbi:poly-gamma-glutamate biosynthesis protein [Treponema primitia ZAS-2]|uniref:Poly-gamma-glutamate biosynthesis protein n=1 Tax=Treponema primitia (strain ATCC BAA-887 / DSM 12427 / ZAS-2) TaxID=545694 RepID=F5YIP5_TREPZ|nr:CapA family protein [Treponema primitia]AEF86589.1 poly-gamma-glutamate biosynthesis protein [Treponema primitia ZAS-2]
MRKSPLLLTLLLFLCACAGNFVASCTKPQPVYLGLSTPGTELSPEQAVELQAAASFLAGLLARELVPLGMEFLGTELAAEPRLGTELHPDLVLELSSRWVFELIHGDRAVPNGSPQLSETELPDTPFLLSRTWMVPCTKVPDGRQDAALEDCLLGKEELLSLRELAPPYVALRVDGLSADDEAYPLVRLVEARLGVAEEGLTEKARAKAETLAGQLAAKLGVALAAVANPLVEPKPEILWLASAGDLMLDRGAGEILLREGPESLFFGAAKILEEADLAIVNLEGAVSSRGYREEKTYNFRFSPPVAGALKKSGIDAVLLANNHVFDWGPQAFLDTLEHVGAAGLGILGAGPDRGAAAAPWVFQKKGITVRAFGIGSFPPERSGWSGARMAAGEGTPGILHGYGSVEALKEVLSAGAIGEDAPGILAGDAEQYLNIVFFHGGEEWTNRPDRATREWYTDIIRAGADLLIGSHPHIVQGFEWIEGKPVFWSLGNFVFAGMENTGGGDEGLLIRLGYWGTELVYVEPYPLALTGPRVRLAPMEKLSGFYALSK